MKNHNFFLFTNKNALAKPKSELKSIFLGLMILLVQNHMFALINSVRVNNDTGINLITPCPNIPSAPSPQIICQWDSVAALKATVDAGATLLWYSTATGGTPLDPFATLVPGNYYAAAVNADKTCESTRQLVVVATNNALYFNGIRDFVQLSNSPIKDKATEFTIEAWIKPDDSNWNSGYHAIFGAIQTGANNQRSPSFYLLDGRVHIDSYEDITLKRFDILTDNALILKNVWSHIALVKAGTTYSVYVNGILVATAPAPAKVNVATGSIYTFGVVDNYFAGLIDEARFWNTARTASEIAANMNINLTGTETGLVDYYTFNQGIANGDNTAITTLFDGTAPQNNGTIQNFGLTGTSSNFVGGYFAQILSPSSTTIVGGTIQLTHTAPGGVWSSSSDAIATVNDSTGLVTGVSGGTAVISYTLCGLSTTIPINVLPNLPPTISQITDQSTCPGTSLLPLTFAIGDDTTPVNSLVLTATSSNTALIPDSQIVLGGTGANRTVTLTTAAGQSGTATITIKATDANGAISTMSFKASYIDTTKPTVLTQNITIPLDALGVATITSAQINNGSTDNCGIATVTVIPSSFTCANIGVNPVIVTVTDVNGNFQTGTATVTVTETTKPTVITKDITVVLDASGNASITAAQINNGSTDNCGIATTTVSPSTFSCTNIGPNTVTLTVTDVNGNIQTGTAIVTVKDSTKPNVITQNISVVLDASGTASITAAQINNGSTDNCSIATVTVSPTSFSCVNVGSNTVTLTVTDVNGNIQTGTATVVVTETTKPTVITKNIQVELDANGIATITAAQINNGSTDNCSIATTTVSPSTFSCANIGSNTVTLTVIDASGNFQTGTAIVTIKDSTKPNVIAKDITVVLDTSGNASITANQIDNGSSDNCASLTFTASNLDFNCNNIGANSVILTVKDGSGNTSQGTAIVTIISKGCDLEVSQAITPNGDGINDTWQINNLDGHPNTTIRVFNRWGAEVFFSNNYKNDWDGHYKNSKNDLPASGAYYYQIDIDSDGTIENQGWLYITK
jgi:gliding motility-associated-like protein